MGAGADPGFRQCANILQPRGAGDGRLSFRTSFMPL